MTAPSTELLLVAGSSLATVLVVTDVTESVCVCPLDVSMTKLSAISWGELLQLMGRLDTG